MAKVVITNAIVFDGHALQENIIVTIENGLSSSINSSADTSNATIIDGRGQTLLPGFIDAHVHLANDAEIAARLLSQLAKAGVTTALDMGYFSGAVRNSLTNRPGIAELHIAGNFASATGSMHSRITKASLIDSPESAVSFVEDRVAEGADYIKIVGDVPGPSQEVIDTLVYEARRHGKLTVAHAASSIAFPMAQKGKVDIITHVPLDLPLHEASARLMKDEGRACVPTLVMAETVANAKMFPGLTYEAAKKSVAQLHKAGVPILVGTDANQSTLASVKHGESLHQELRLLIDAGFSTEDALKSCTSLTAKLFRLENRGEIAVGKRADLVLVDGNPLEDITATEKVERVWISGKEVELE
jgi:imidazolonepropionase-like amidohydrolase